MRLTCGTISPMVTTPPIVAELLTVVNVLRRSGRMDTKDFDIV